jgi:hypothetical protein
MDPSEYCRDVETYLCRKNEGHLIRIVGPAFEQVGGWARQGVPLKVVFRGIDQYCERYYAKGARRRPVRIEFCEGDVLDLFDAWRRAVGVAAAPASPEPAASDASPRKGPLAAHFERAIARLTSARAGGAVSPEMTGAIASIVRELDALLPEARQARGDARARLVERLAVLDRTLMDAALREVDAARAAELRREAEAELAPFGSRMTADARARALDAAFERLVRDASRLPILEYR